MSSLKICQNQENPLNIGGDNQHFGVPKFKTPGYLYLFSEASEKYSLKFNETAVYLNYIESSPKGFGGRWPLIQRNPYFSYGDLGQI